MLARSLSARVWFLVTLRALLFMSATPPPVQSYHQGASHRKSRSPSIPRLRNNSKRSMLCLTTVVLLGWVVVAIKDDAVVSSLLDRFFYTTSRYSTLGLPGVHARAGQWSRSVGLIGSHPIRGSRTAVEPTARG